MRLQVPYFTSETINHEYIVTIADGERLAAEFLINLLCLLSWLSVYGYMRWISGEGVYLC